MRISLSNVFLPLTLLAGCPLLSAQSPQECPVEDLPLNRVRSASLAQGDCVSRGRLADVYRIRLTKRGTLQIRVASNSFKPELVLAAEAGRRITSSESPELRCDLTPGAYIVYVTTATAGASGGYTIRASLLEACPVISLELNSHRSSALTPDCRNSNGEPEHRYAFSLDQPGRVVAELDMKLGRSYITLWGPDDEPIAGGAKSVLSAPLVPGAYRLYVKTKDNSTGPYSLRLHGPCPVGEFKISGELAGALGPDDCRVREVLLDSTDSSYSRHFRFRIASRGLLSLSLSSLQNTMSLLVLNDVGAKVGDTSALPSGSASSLNIRLVPGSYTLRLSSKDDARYVLTSSFQTRPCVTRTLSLGMATQQSVSEDDCLVNEFFPSLTERTPAHLYKVQLSEAADLYHRLGSNPTQMRILDAVSLSALVPTLHPSSDAPEVSTRLAPGSYYVFIALTGGSQASYALDLRRLECRVQAITLNTQVQSNFREDTCASGFDLVRKFGFTLSLRHTFDFQVIQTTETVGLLLHSDSSVVGSTPKSNASGTLKGILDPGRYVVEVYSPAGHISDFALRTSACPIGSLALNGVWQLEYASSLQGAACGGRTARQFYISIPSPRTIDVELRASSADFVAQLLTSELLPFGPATPSGKAINLTRGVGGGTYILEIRSSGPFTGTYRIRGSLR